VGEREKEEGRVGEEENRRAKKESRGAEARR